MSPWDFAQQLLSPGAGARHQGTVRRDAGVSDRGVAAALQQRHDHEWLQQVTDFYTRVAKSKNPSRRRNISTPASSCRWSNNSFLADSLPASRAGCLTSVARFGSARGKRKALDGLNVSRQQIAGLIDIPRPERLQDQPVILIGSRPPAGAMRGRKHQSDWQAAIRQGWRARRGMAQGATSA